MAWNTFDHLTLTLAQADDAPPAETPADLPPAEAPGDGGEAATTQVDGNTPLGEKDGNGSAGSGSPFGGQMIWIFLLVLVVMWVFLMGGQRKEKKKRAALLAALAKGDKVQTVGGVLGTVVEVRDTEVVVKVDENSNARMRFSRSAIQTVLGDGDEPTKEK